MSKEGTKMPRRLKGLNPVFHKKTQAEDDAVVSDAVLKLAKKSGKLNLSSRNLSTSKHFPCKFTNFDQDFRSSSCGSSFVERCAF